MLINLKVKTLDARTHEFSIDNELTIRQFKDQIAEKTSIAAENQRIIYQGRVLADEKQIKEYDVDGKVLHVAERPPFSQRGSNSRNNDEPRPMRNVARPQVTMRSSPFFRALDGMLVGTMAIPMTSGPEGGNRNPPNRFPNSSSFCINRITVALHMIECANNIVAYLENPEVGLNNQSLDILQRGRWTMESTVVEVGVASGDMPPTNNIIDMVQDAVTAALSRNTNGRNYTVVQLPTVYTNEGGEGLRNGNEASQDGTAGLGGSDSNEETTAAAVIIEDVIETDDEAGDGASDRSTPPLPETQESTEGAAAAAADTATAPSVDATNDNATDGEPAAGGTSAATATGSRRRTRPQVLANVIEQFRNVQRRLAPFVDRYYGILNEDPTFEETDTAGREEAQRIFDRVSEAFHYLSHAQHAISDLMLDLSQPGPRVLTCRPILVEQSGYIRPNNIFGANIVATPLNELYSQAPGSIQARPSAQQVANPELTLRNSHMMIDSPGAGSAAAFSIDAQQPLRLMNPTAAARIAQQNARRASAVAGAAAELAAEATAAAEAASNFVAGTVEDPVDEPMVAPNRINAAGPNPTGAQPQEPRADLDEVAQQPVGAPPRLRVYMPVSLPPPNHQVQMARLIQAVVNNATADATNVHVEFSSPNIMSINLPVHVMAAAVHPAHRAPVSTTATAATAAATNTESASTAATNTGNTNANTGSVGETHGAASTSSGTRSGEQRANTLPTTATQTRSTSRQQIHVGGGNNNWPGRIAPTHSAFDRFLPCNSHHIREPEPPAPNNNNNNNNNVNRSANAAPSETGAVGAGTAAASGTQTFVITDRLPRGQSGTRIWPLRRRPAINQQNSLASQARMALVGGAGTNLGTTRVRRSSAPSNRSNAGRSARQIPTMLANLLVTNLRNNAQTASAGRANSNNIDLDSSNDSTPAPLAATPNSTLVLQLPSLSEANNLRTQLRSFLHQTVFEGAPINDETIPPAINRALTWFGDCLLYLPQYERPEYNSRDSVCNLLRVYLCHIIELCNAPASESTANFEQRLKQICEQFRVRLYSVLFVCVGRANAELYWRQLMRLLCVPLRSNFHNEALQFLCIYIDPTIPSSTDTADAQQFLVLRSTDAAAIPATNADQQPPQQQTIDSDIEMADVASSSNSSSAETVSMTAAEPEEPLPQVNVGSEPWHSSFPNEWLPVITRDMQSQTQTLQQPPYSDAYISGMSAKRRKIIQSEKPAATVEALIASGVQRAINNSGVGTPNNSSAIISVDAVVDTIARDGAVQSSYTEAMRSNVRERLKKDVDYKPNKYPQITKFAEPK